MNVICTFWFDLALITGVLGFRLCSAMFEAVIGTIAQLSLGATLGAGGTWCQTRLANPQAHAEGGCLHRVR